MFLDFAVFFSLLFVHELGHSFVGVLLGFTLEEIRFYPYGGVSKFNFLINRSMRDELLMLLSGPIVQCLFYGLVIQFLPINICQLYRMYHYNILFFNLLPICILDGGKLIHLLFSYCISYWKSLKLLYFVSYFTCLTFLFITSVNHQLQFVFLSFFLLGKVTVEYKKRHYYYQKFLLERYLHEFSFSRRRIVKEVRDMRKGCTHLFHTFLGYKTEKEILSKKFRKNY